MVKKKTKKAQAFTVSITAHVEVETLITVNASNEEEARGFAECYMEDNMTVELGSKCGDITIAVDYFDIHYVELDE